jgi:thiol-disulfide isomerase/thioredoxin
MLRIIHLCLAMLLLHASVSASHFHPHPVFPGVKFTALKGRIANTGDLKYVDTVTISYSTATNHEVLHLRVKDGAFSVSVPLLEPVMVAQMSLNYRNLDKRANILKSLHDSRRFLIEDVPIFIQVMTSAQDAIVRAGKENIAMDDYLATVAPLYRSIDSLRAKRSSMDSALYRVTFKRFNAEEAPRQRGFIERNLSAWYALVQMENIVKDFLKIPATMEEKKEGLLEYSKLFHALAPHLREQGSHILVQLENSIEQQFIPFKGEMPDGNVFDVESLKGKIFLIDFWGSWCGWCRKGHPHLKELYAKYKDKGFEIIGIGHEIGGARAEQWKKFNDAITKDGVTWPQVLNDPSKHDLVKAYMVQAYPTKVLVDRDGKVLLRVTDDHERMIDARLEALLGDE